jgi:hypothetical protein
VTATNALGTSLASNTLTATPAPTERPAAPGPIEVLNPMAYPRQAYIDWARVLEPRTESVSSRSHARADTTGADHRDRPSPRSAG